MANDLLTAKKLAMNTTVESHKRDLSMALHTAQRLWEKVEGREFNTLEQSASFLTGLRGNLQSALASLDALENLPIPVPTGGNGSPLKNVGEAGDDGKH